MTLELGHWNFAIGKRFCKFFSVFFLTGIEFQEHSSYLLEACVVQENVVVCSSRSKKCWIKFFFVIGRHEYDAAFLGTNAIHCIEKPRKGKSAALSLSSLSIINLFSLDKHGINIFKKNNCIRWCIIYTSCQTIIVHVITAQVQVTDSEIELTSNNLCVRSFSRSWWPKEKISTAVRYTLIRIPLSWILKFFDVLNNFLRYGPI